ncbi:MAG: AMP-binding protein [Minwuia sp.]|uniref:AMP-binding protein n=1 Tax=Minwuia sp. TaxID=2493630 RepID=UPI003A87212F
MNMAEHLYRSAKLHGDLPAVAVGENVTASYRDLAGGASRLARGLRDALGLAPGDRVALIQKNGPDYLEGLYGVWWAGLTAVPVNAKLHPREFEYILANSKARAALVSPDLAEAVADACAGLESPPAVIVCGSADHRRLRGGEGMAAPIPDDGSGLGWIFYTSGTTGQPKGAMLSHRNLLLMTLNYFADVDALGTGEALIHAAPMSHGSGLYALPHVARASVNVTPESGGFDPAETLRLIARWRDASFFFAPTMVHRLINDPRTGDADTSNLKTIVYGGGPMYVADISRAMELMGQKFVQIYGQGEAPMTITGLSREMHRMTDHPRYAERLGSVGVARTDVEVRVVDETDNPLPAGEIGEVAVRGPVVMQGYLDRPDATAETLKGGWLHTGDMGSFDEDGFLTLKDRSKDMIISGGTNIYPREIEEVLLRHPLVAEASVVGRPHPDWGEEVVAFIVAADASPEPGELDRLCLDNIARFKRPKDYRFVEALPKNNYGKVLKTELRKLV